MTKKKQTQSPFQKNKYEIMYNLINCFIAGALVFLGSLSSGSLTKTSILFTIVAFALTFLVKFQKYLWRPINLQFIEK